MEEKKSGFEIQKVRISEIMTEIENKPSFDESRIEIREIIRRFADLEMDLEYVKNINTELSAKYQSLMDTFPTSSELEYLLYHFSGLDLGYDEEIKQNRIALLTKFKSALVCLEGQNPKQTYKYDQSDIKPLNDGVVDVQEELKE